MSFSRRSFLRGTAGAIIALPFLEAMPQAAQAGVDATKRFILFNRPWGTIPSHWIPDGVGSDFRLKEILSPLEGLKSRGKLSVVTGVSMESAQSQYEGAGSHPVGENHALTAKNQRNQTFRCIKWVDGHDQEVPVGSHRECSDGNLDIFGDAGGPSIDTVIAPHIRGSARLSQLVVGRASINALTSDMSGARVPAITSCDSLFEVLFADGSTDDPGFENARRRRRSILDHAGQDMDRLRSRVSTADRMRLDSHYESIRELERGLDSVRRMCTLPDRPAPGLTFEGENWRENILLAHRMIAMALACDITRTVSLYWHIDGVPVPSLTALDSRIASDPHGDGSHAFPDQPEKIANAVALHKVWMGLYGHLADELDNTERLEGDGSTVLDNSVLLHTSDMATGLHTFKAGVGAWNRREGGQYSRGMPYCIAGSAGGALRTNQHFVLDDESYTGRYGHGEFLLTMARAVGVSAEALPVFGEPEFCERTVDELLT